MSNYNKLTIIRNNGGISIDSGNRQILVDGTPINLLGPWKPLKCSEIEERLLNRNYNQCEYIFTDTQGNLRYKNNEILHIIPEVGIVCEANPEEIDNSILLGGISDNNVVTNKYKNIFGSDMSNVVKEICFFSSSKNKIDMENFERSIDLVSGFDTYTDMIDLGSIINFSTTPGISGRVDLSIQYSIASGNIYNYNTKFKAFSYTEENGLEIENLVEEVNDLVKIEYLGGVVKILPISENVIECVINKGLLVYGKLG